MEAKDYFNRGKGHLDKGSFSLAVEDFWKAMELTHGQDAVKTLREQFKGVDPTGDPESIAVFLQGALAQIL